MKSHSLSFRTVKILLICIILSLLASSSFSQAKREYTFKNDKLVGVEESCSFTLSAASANAPMEGTNGTVDVTCSSVCNWTASSNNSWITITGGSSGSGNGTVNYSVASNSGSARSGTITIEDQTFSVNQAADSCYEFCYTAYEDICIADFYAGCEYQCQGSGPCMSACMSYFAPIVATVCTPVYCYANQCQ